jgi:hypothetical protein
MRLLIAVSATEARHAPDHSARDTRVKSGSQGSVLCRVFLGVPVSNSGHRVKAPSESHAIAPGGPWESQPPGHPAATRSLREPGPAARSEGSGADNEDG